MKTQIKQQGANLRYLLSWRGIGPALTGAVISGLLLSSAFPPLEWHWAVWFALLPLLTAPIPRRLSRRVMVGFVFGYTHFATSLHWLNEVGFFAGYLLALYCALYFLAWYLVFADVVNRLQSTERSRYSSSTVSFTRLRLTSLGAGKFTLATLLAAISWVGLEWIRSWFLTGFPWNHLGLSQWRNPGLMQLTTVTGLYGLSFLALIVNGALLWLILSNRDRWLKKQRRQFSWPVLAAIIAFLPVLCLMYQSRRPLPKPDTEMRIAAIQGNLPQARVWSQEQLDQAIRVYDQLTREAAELNPDIIVWPETAVPAPAFFNRQYQQSLYRLTNDIETRLLFGNMHLERIDIPISENHEEQPEYNNFNSVFLLDREGEIEEYYHKVRLVPFGEYVPLGNIFPFLHDLIGMGRDLSAGSEYTLFDLENGVWAGVNICFEDAFPQVSAEFLHRGANLLMTLTNNAWFEESAGSRQHFTHAVARAVESRRPLLRSGNNSDTALILPNGEVRDLLYDSATGDRFIRDWHIYRIPVWFDLGTTFYTRYGNIFAILCTLAWGFWMVNRTAQAIKEKMKNQALITGGQ